ncbi:MAG: hypothetical protein ACFFBC_08060 [Promethearchaeota archaeon]
MAYKVIKVIIIMVVVCFSLIFSVPIVILSTILSPYGKIIKSIPFYYKPSNPSFMEELNINMDLGNIEIKYINEPVDYCAKLEMNIEMIGSNLAGKSCFDYFNIVWQNTSSIVNFTMDLKENIDQVEVLSLIESLNITVTLNANVICDISVILNIEGSAKITVPFGISVGNVLTNVSKGNIYYDLYYCIIEGEIIGIVKETGNIKLKTSEVEYMNDSLWAFTANIGNIIIEINQFKTMGANITGTVGTNIGNYRLIYLDNNVNVGAHFVLSANQNDVPFHQRLTEIVGFEEPILDVVDGIDIYTLNSNEYPTLNNYNLSFSLPNGYYDIDLQNS